MGPVGHRKLDPDSDTVGVVEGRFFRNLPDTSMELKT
jgi:hypothetical protein